MTQPDLLAWTPPAAPEPMPPHQRGSDTSRAAAASVRQDTARLRQIVHDFLRRCGPEGATDEEGDRVLGLGPNTYRPRRVELVAKGWVADSGRKRPTATGRLATVWVAT